MFDLESKCWNWIVRRSLCICDRSCAVRRECIGKYYIIGYFNFFMQASLIKLNYYYYYSCRYGMEQF